MENRILVENTEVDDEQFGNQIAEIRENEAKLTQKQLADKAGVTERTIQKIEAGVRVKLETAKAVANALGYEATILYYLRKK